MDTGVEVLSTMYADKSAESQLSAFAVKQSKESRRSEDGPESVRRRFAALDAAKIGGASAVRSPSPRLLFNDILWSCKAAAAPSQASFNSSREARC